MLLTYCSAIAFVGTHWPLPVAFGRRTLRQSEAAGMERPYHQYSINATKSHCGPQNGQAKIPAITRLAYVDLAVSIHLDP